jgi:hypothetical protein
MFNYNPAERLTLDDVMSHAWMQGLYATPEEVQTELVNRREELGNF